MAGQYQDRQDSKIYGSRLIIHRRVDLDNNNFYFRAKVSGHTGYIRRSCQTSDPARAMLRRKICGSICSVLENGQISDQTQAVFVLTMTIISFVIWQYVYSILMVQLIFLVLVSPSVAGFISL